MREDDFLMESVLLGARVRGNWLLWEVNIQVRQGRTLVILGPNGAGKTVLLRLLHGLAPPDTGDVLWNGRPLDIAARLCQSMVFQKPVLLRRSAEANLHFALRARGHRATDARQRTALALEQAGLGHLARRPARVLSGGEQQRLALARALVLDPQLLFLDEPTASLDPAATEAVEQMVGQAREAGVTLVMVTHDRGQAERLADDVVFLQAGRVVEAAPADTFFANPQTEPAMAWLEGRLYTAD